MVNFKEKSKSIKDRKTDARSELRKALKSLVSTLCTLTKFDKLMQQTRNSDPKPVNTHYHSKSPIYVPSPALVHLDQDLRN